MKKPPLIPPTKNTAQPKPADQTIQIQGDPVAFMATLQRSAAEVATGLYKAQDLVSILYQGHMKDQKTIADLQAKVDALEGKKGGK